MVFNSLEELKGYVEEAQKVAIKSIAEKEQRILRDEVMKQVYNAYDPTWYNRSWSLYNNIKYYINGNEVTLILENNGNWHSAFNDSKLVYAFDTLEAGTTWARKGTNIADITTKKVSSEIPKVFKQAMRHNGVPIT